MAELAQAYIHLKPYRASDRKLKGLGRSAERLAIRTATRIYGGGVDVIVELEEGSLRTRITVVGTIMLGVYSGVADYSGFKQSISELCDEAREFSVDVCKPFVKKAKASEDQIYRFERRLKTPGKLKRLSRHLERLERQSADLSSKNMAKELAAARHELEQIASDLSSTELQEVTKAISPEKLPPPEKWPEAVQPRIGLKQSEHQEPMFELPVLEDTAPPRRLIYRSRTAVPPTKKRTEKRSLTSQQPRLLPPL